MRAFWLCCVAVAVSGVIIVVLTARSTAPPIAPGVAEAVAPPEQVAFTNEAASPSAAVTEHRRVLFIGNSYTLGNDLPGTVSLLAEANGLPLDVGVEAQYGFSLTKHLEYATVTDELQNGDWDVVIVQEHSLAPADRVSFETWTMPAVAELAAEAEASGTDVVFFQTWAHRSGSAEAGHPDYESMQSAVVDSYAQLSETHQAPVAAVGQAWKRALDSYPELNLYVADGTHPSPTGSYLAALTIARTLVNEPLASAEPIGIGSGVAEILLRIVNETAASG